MSRQTIHKKEINIRGDNMEDTNKKSLITAVEIILLLVVLYIIAGFLTGYLESVEGELITTVLNSPALLI